MNNCEMAEIKSIETEGGVMNSFIGYWPLKTGEKKLFHKMYTINHKLTDNNQSITLYCNTIC